MWKCHLASILAENCKNSNWIFENVLAIYFLSIPEMESFPSHRAPRILAFNSHKLILKVSMYTF